MNNINIHTDCPGYGTNIALLDGGRIAHTKYGSVFSQCLDDTIELMQSYLKNIQGGKFVEIGVLGGASLLYNYDLCKTNNIEIYGIDPFEDIDIFNGKEELNTAKHIVDYARSGALKRRLKLEKIITDHNLNITLIKNTSGESSKMFDDNSISILHIDGDHSYNGVKSDMNNFWSKIKSGGIIINDDYTWGCCKKAIQEFVQNHESEISSSYKAPNCVAKHIIIKK